MKEGKNSFKNKYQEHAYRQEYNQADIFLDKNIIKRRLDKPCYGGVNPGYNNTYYAGKRDPFPVWLN